MMTVLSRSFFPSTAYQVYYHAPFPTLPSHMPILCSFKSSASHPFTTKTVVFHREENGKKVQEKFNCWVADLFEKVLAANRMEEIKRVKEQLLATSSPLMRLSEELYEREEVSAVVRHFCALHQTLPLEELRSCVERFVVRVLEDFKRGEPHSFPMMAILLAERHLGYQSLGDRLPFNDIKESLNLLKILASRGVNVAKEALYRIYFSDAIGSEEGKIPLELSREERSEGLRALREEMSSAKGAIEETYVTPEAEPKKVAEEELYQLAAEGSQDARRTLFRFYTGIYLCETFRPDAFQVNHPAGFLRAEEQEKVKRLALLGFSPAQAHFLKHVQDVEKRETLRALFRLLHHAS